MWDYLFEPKSKQSPLEKEPPCKLIFTWKTCSMEILFTAFQYTPYVKHNLHLITPLHRVCSHLFCALGNWAGLSPLKQRVWASLQVDLPHSSSEKIMCSIEVTHLHCVGRQHVLHASSLCWKTTRLTCLFTVLEDNTSYMKHYLEHDYLPRELNFYRSNLTGVPLRLPLRPGDRTSPTHTTKFGAWLWYYL